ncbi:unnamed protein product [Gordionus sp. m RMFG-2023]
MKVKIEYLKFHVDFAEFRSGLEYWKKLYSSCNSTDTVNGDRCSNSVTGKQHHQYNNREQNEGKSHYEFLDENSNTTLYKKFQLLNIPNAFFIHNASELCSNLSWSYDFSSYFGKSATTSPIIDYMNKLNIADNVTSLYQTYLNIINDSANNFDEYNLFKYKLEKNSLHTKVNRDKFSTSKYISNIYGKPPIKQMSLIIGLFTKPTDFEIRRNLRKIWESPLSVYFKSSYSTDANYTSSYFPLINSRNETVICKVKTVFILGIFEPKTVATVSKFSNISTEEIKRLDKNRDRERKEVQATINSESLVHGDIVQATFTENYTNLSYKTGALLKWVSTHCNKAQFLLKMDVDIYARLDILMSVLENITSANIESEASFTDDKIVGSAYQRISKKYMPEKIQVIHNKSNNDQNINESPVVDDLLAFQKSFYCKVWVKMPVLRNRRHKNLVDVKDFESNFYPKYCSGPAYIMSPRLAGILYRKSLECCAKPFPNEDAFWTGIIPNKTISLKYTNLDPYYEYGNKNWSEKNYIFANYYSMMLVKKLYFYDSYL